LAARTKKRTVWLRIVQRTVGIRIRSKKAWRLESKALATWGPRFSTAPLRGSRMVKARKAKMRPGAAVTKKAVRQP